MPAITRKDIDGLTLCGSTAQTIAIAEALSRSQIYRDKLRKGLNELESKNLYSHHDFDKRARLADFLADLLREAKELA